MNKNYNIVTLYYWNCTGTPVLSIVKVFYLVFKDSIYIK